MPDLTGKPNELLVEYLGDWINKVKKPLFFLKQLNILV